MPVISLNNDLQMQTESEEIVMIVPPQKEVREVEIQFPSQDG
jgi:hypothetical protein